LCLKSRPLLEQRQLERTLMEDALHRLATWHETQTPRLAALSLRFLLSGLSGISETAFCVT
jgi:hypothetical protein